MNRTPCRESRHEQGFTLIEVMIVVAIAGLLTALAAPVYNNVINDGRTQALALDLRGLHQSMMRYHADTGSFPSEAEFDGATLEPLITGGYYSDAESLLGKLLNNEVTVYIAPDIGGPDQHYVLVARHVQDPSIVVVAIYTDLIEQTEGWVDGVYVITEGELEEAL